MDLNGNGVSRIWELRYEGVVPTREADDDGDGTSNYDEGVAGTDPTNGASRLEMKISFADNDELEFTWSAEAGKSYCIERWNSETGAWEAVAVKAPSLIHEPVVLTMGSLDAGLFRLGVSDVDLDGDGLSAWEEHQLGLSDNDPAGGTTGEGDFMAALRRLENPEGLLTSDGVRLRRMLPDEEGAVRFLLKASFGPDEESMARVMELGYTGWIDEQFALPASSLYSEMFQNGLSYGALMAKRSWWRLATKGDDQLRQRMAYALSQILVVNFEGGSWIGDNPLVQGRFYDIFGEGAFGSYRDVLEKVTYSPVMGFYLSHLKNRKTDDPENPSRFPDENFAREIMQLFTIGLWELNQDGSRQLDEDGDFIPTYDNGTITEMAKVFTGMSFSTTDQGQPAESFYDTYRGNDFMYPMKVWDEEHEPGAKSIINGVVLDGTQTGEEEVQAALDALMSHQSTAPFLSRFFIQRFTSSNPSPEYLARVSRVWNDGNDGDPGHLGKVVEAILLDPETLNPDEDDPFRGKLREPIIRYTSLARTFGINSTDDEYWVHTTSVLQDFGQYPMLSKSVFNFYSPDFAPDRYFRSQGMVSPESELSSLTQLLASDSRFSYTIDSGLIRNATLDYSNELALADDPARLLDRVDLLLTGGRLKGESRAAILMAIENETNSYVRVKTAIYLVSQSAACVILN